MERLINHDGIDRLGCRQNWTSRAAALGHVALRVVLVSGNGAEVDPRPVEVASTGGRHASKMIAGLDEMMTATPIGPALTAGDENEGIVTTDHVVAVEVVRGTAADHASQPAVLHLERSDAEIALGPVLVEVAVSALVPHHAVVIVHDLEVQITLTDMFRAAVAVVALLASAMTAVIESVMIVDPASAMIAGTVQGATDPGTMIVGMAGGIGGPDARRAIATSLAGRVLARVRIRIETGKGGRGAGAGAGVGIEAEMTGIGGDGHAAGRGVEAVVGAGELCKASLTCSVVLLYVGFLSIRRRHHHAGRFEVISSRQRFFCYVYTLANVEHHERYLDL